MSNFVTKPRLRIRGDRFVLDGAVTYEGHDESWTVPSGFATDLASVPWWAFWLLPRIWEPRDHAALLHDFWYSTKIVSRKDADRLMLRIMLEENQRVWRAFLIYFAVRGFGWWAWRKR